MDQPRGRGRGRARPQEPQTAWPQPSQGGSAWPQPPQGGSAWPRPPQGGSAVPQPPQSGSAWPQPPQGGSAWPRPPQGGSAVPQPPQSGSAWPQPSQGGSAGPQPPQSGSAWPQPPQGGSAWPQPPRPNPPASRPSTSGSSGQMPAVRPTQAWQPAPPAAPVSAASLVTPMGEMALAQRAPSMETRGGGAVGESRRPRRLVYTEEAIIGRDQFPTSLEQRYGTQGKKMKVITNYCGFLSIPVEWRIVMYDTNFPPTVKAKTVVERYRLMLRMQQSGIIPPCSLAYDGRCVFASAPIREEEQFIVRLEEEGAISFRRLAEIPPGTEQWYRVINIIFNLCQQQLGQKKYGNDFFVPPSNDVRNVQFNNPSTLDDPRPGRFKLGDDFEVLQGFGVTLQRAQIQNRVLPIMHVSGIHRLANLHTALDLLNNNPREAANLPGRTVLTRYNNRTYIVVDVIRNVSIDTSFPVGPDGTATFRGYFAQRYNIQLQHSQQPFLKVKLRRVDRLKRLRRARESSEEVARAEVPDDIQLPAELCYLTGFSEQEKMRFQRDRSFVEICRKMPSQRVKDVGRFCGFIRSSPEAMALLQSWRLEIDSKPIEVEARTLDSCFRPNQAYGKASLNTRRLRPVKPANKPNNVITIAVIQGSPRTNITVIQNYVQKLCSEAAAMEFSVAWPAREVISGPGSIVDKLMHARQQQVDIVLVAVDEQRSYKEIKTTCIEQGILSQVVRTPTMNKPPTAQKVVLQMACKVGFTPWTLAKALPNPEQGFMIVGVDTFVGKSSSAVQAAVFSLNADCSKYYTYVSYLQGRNMEVHANFDVAFREALLAYRQNNNGRLPMRIFVYRDGVGDSQLLNVREIEVAKIHELLKQEYGAKQFHLIVTVVKKRINQRFFVPSGDGAVNVPPGTVVDSQIVKPNWVEYFIVPQESTQGTATPTNFNIIFNNASKSTEAMYLPPDELQRTTFALTHLYFNWTGTIRVPAPVQYAHKCAFLLGQCAINSAIHRNIKENLFYL